MQKDYQSSTSSSELPFRKRRTLPDISIEELTAQEFKKLKISETTSQVKEEHSERACQAIIPYIPAISEDYFKFAISTDFPESSLTRLIREYSRGSDPAKADDSMGKELVIYQPPLSELLKEAAFIDAHQMSLE